MLCIGVRFIYGIDSITESKIHEALKNLTQDKTVITIAHDLSILQYMDNILVFDDGKIVEQGNHEQLLKKTYVYKNGEKLDGIYKQMWDNQANGYADNNTAIKKINDTIKDVFGSITSLIKSK